MHHESRHLRDEGPCGWRGNGGASPKKDLMVGFHSDGRKTDEIRSETAASYKLDGRGEEVGAPW